MQTGNEEVHILLGARSIFIFHLEICYFEEKVVHRILDKNMSFQGTKSDKKNTCYDYKKKAQISITHSLNSMKLLFSGHSTGVFNLRMSY